MKWELYFETSKMKMGNIFWNEGVLYIDVMEVAGTPLVLIIIKIYSLV